MTVTLWWPVSTSGSSSLACHPKIMQNTLTQFVRRAAPNDSDDDLPGDAALPQQQQQQANNDAEQPMMMQAAASSSASNSNDNVEMEEAAGNDEVESDQEDYELSQVEFDKLTQQFGDNLYDDDEDEAKEQDSDAEKEEEDEPEDTIQHRDLTQEVLEPGDEEDDDDAKGALDHASENKV